MTSIRIIDSIAIGRHLCEITFYGGRDFYLSQFTGAYRAELATEMGRFFERWDRVATALPVPVKLATEKLMHAANDLGFRPCDVSTSDIDAEEALIASAQ